MVPASNVVYIVWAVLIHKFVFTRSVSEVEPATAGANAAGAGLGAGRAAGSTLTALNMLRDSKPSPRRTRRCGRRLGVDLRRDFIWAVESAENRLLRKLESEDMAWFPFGLGLGSEQITDADALRLPWSGKCGQDFWKNLISRSPAMRKRHPPTLEKPCQQSSSEEF